MAAGLFNPIFDGTRNATGAILGNSPAANVIGGYAASKIGTELFNAEQKVLQQIRQISAINNPDVAALIGSLLGTLGAQGDTGQARRLADPLLSTTFNAYFNNIGGSLNLSDLSSRIENFTLPFPTFEKLQHYQKGRYLNLAGDYVIPQFTIRFYEDRMMTVTRLMTQWRSRIRDPLTGVAFPRNNYARTFIIQPIDTEQKALPEILFEACWPVSIEQVQFGSGHERVIMSVEFSTDWINFSKYLVPIGKDNKDVPSVRNIAKDTLGQVTNSIASSVNAGAGLFGKSLA